MSKKNAPADGQKQTFVAVIHPVLKSERHSRARSEEASLTEACGLAEAIDLSIQHQEIISLAQISPATYIGKGKTDELKQIFGNRKIELLFVNSALTPGQQRNLETACKVKVIDRTGMILEIFGARARTAEGQLQVELAALTYQRSRLVRSWTHLERQRGGGGFLGGPGEKQLELDRRMLEARIEKIKEELKDVVRTRKLQRQSRERNAVPSIALIGYTNAGKSTLFNRLTSADVLAKDMLFATLDPTVRPITLPHGRKVLLSDTVGFIADLPTQLVAAFRATLDEVQKADLLLHVRDISSEESDAQKQDVETVLKELGMEESEWQPRMIEVWNKIDLLDPGRQKDLQNDLGKERGENQKWIAPISAQSGAGIPELIAAIEKKLGQGMVECTIRLPHRAGAAIAWLYRQASVFERTDADTHCELKVLISQPLKQQFSKNFAKFRPTFQD